ncbi:MAG: ribosomal protein S18-alanine N-acetyltransferase [Gammaproteobacteria bacterium]|nr:ribosomal protein S18-alanine N-acetyltransferase [Gammaproteobacteria bacterium]NIR97602.1 ribosomal protein S18-alanine N-acetyltransferase [Gammaproteobacteria bacterium]NIT63252.1 ribosomal protein S18-alanine N-acetyltransferase [Gammaproteobacteria bacterium]NIV20184.1 ribosomal protein S18-alanine N-acetyltransferase [Gammaproteobacteria bacterium]NIY31832.1 ribosomal protein S18-alanine N-acetyltransferase [Gammaproteobacteria bacterium]
MSAVLDSEQLHFRPMRRADLAQVMAVERDGYEHPWTEGIFLDCLRVGYYCRVLELEGRIVAYGVMSSGAGESHVLNLCVHPGSRCQGFGRAMLEHLVEVARRVHSQAVLLEVRPSNKAAVRLYSSLGFNEVGVRWAYYPARDGREDALVMALQL